MKPFNNYDEYLRFLFAFFAAGALFLTGSLVFLFLWDAATGTAHTVEPVKTPVAETRVEALPERPGSNWSKQSRLQARWRSTPRSRSSWLWSSTGRPAETLPAMSADAG